MTIYSPANQEILLHSGEVERLPGGMRLKVVEGAAWITVKSRDIVLEEGDLLVIAEGEALVSGLRNEDLILEVRQVEALAA